MMRSLCVLFFVAGCGSEVPAGNSDPIEVPKTCSTIADCSCPSGYGDAVCGADGLCYCHRTEVVEIGCQSASECQSACVTTAGFLDSVDCVSGVCHCTKVAVPPFSPTVTVAYEGPSAQSVNQGARNVHMLDFSLVANADLTVRSARLDVRVYNNLGVLDSDDAVYFRVRTIKVIDRGSEAILQGPIVSAHDGQPRIGSDGFWHYFLLSEDFDLTAGATRNLSVVLDVDGLFPSGYSLDVEFSLRPEDAPWASYVKNMVANEYLEGDQIIGDPLASQRATVQ